MWSAVLALSVVVAMDPVRIGMTALLISRPQPMRNLLAFWLGGMAAGIAVASVVLLWLREWAVGAMRAVETAASNPIVGQIQVLLGVLAALIAVRVLARKRTPVPTGRGASIEVLPPGTDADTSRPSIRRRLESGSMTAVFVAGLALATPPVEYLAVLITILASSATTAVQLGAALTFTVVAFTVVEVPLISYLASPTKTLAVVQRVHEWISARRNSLPAVVIGCVGALLVVTGIGKVWG
jgi:Sap, sulfolipid-1-addressing protein